jgi:hypothetical protein
MPMATLTRTKTATSCDAPPAPRPEIVTTAVSLPRGVAAGGEAHGAHAEGARRGDVDLAGGPLV